MVCQLARGRRVPDLIVRVLSASRTTGFVEFGHFRFRCALGRGGVRVLKREGDGATPRGRWTISAILYNPARVRRPRTALSTRQLRPDDGWCDAASDRNYNRPVRHPYPASAERLWRDDGPYDLIVVLDYNARPRVQGGGSAIFLHVASDGFPPTEGCVAVERKILLRVLERFRRGSTVRILA